MKEVQRGKSNKKHNDSKEKKQTKRHEVPAKDLGWVPNPEYKFATLDRTMLKPGCPQILEALEHDLLKWCKTDDAISMDGFVSVSYLATPRLYEYAQKHEGLKTAIEMAKHLIGQRRERFALEGKYNANVVIKTMPLYSPEYKAWVQEYQKGATAAATGGGTRYIVVDTMPNSDLVPERKHVEEDDDSE